MSLRADNAAALKALDMPAATVRLYLLYGPDEAGSEALAARFGKGMGQGAERIDLDGPTLRSDPARLSDEAAAISMFGDKRWIRVQPAGEEVLPAVEALFDAPQAGDPVVIIAGNRKDGSGIANLIVRGVGQGSYAVHDTVRVVKGRPFTPGSNEVIVGKGIIGRFKGLELDNDFTFNISVKDYQDFNIDWTQGVSVSMGKHLALKVSLQFLYAGEPALEEVDVIARVILVDPDGIPGNGDEFFETVETGGIEITAGEDVLRKEPLDTTFRTSLQITF